MNSKAMWAIIAVLVIIGGVYFFSLPKETTPVASEDTNLPAAEVNGRVVFSVTDAAANMGNVSELNMKVNSVAVHSSGSAGVWTTVSTTPRTYNLLALKASGNSELLADVNTEVGSYDQVRLMIDSIVVKTKDGVNHDAKLPSGELKINTILLVEEDNTASVSFDFLADKSLHITGNGTYIFAPVVKTESRSDATVAVGAKNVVTISGGKSESSNTMGMDIDGSVKLNFQINNATKLNIGTDNIIKIGN